MNATYRYGPALLNMLGFALLLGLTWSLIQQYSSIATFFFELTGVALLVALPVAIKLVHATRTPPPAVYVIPLLLLILFISVPHALYFIWVNTPFPYLDFLIFICVTACISVYILIVLACIFVVLIGCALVVVLPAAIRLVHVLTYDFTI